MDLKAETRGHATVVAVTGSLDALTSPELAEFMSGKIRDGNTRLVADLSRLEYTSSAGLRVLLNGVKEARQRGGDLRLAGVQPNVKKVLDLSGFTSILKTFGDVDSAVASYS